jgi:hypothetical protein
VNATLHQLACAFVASTLTAAPGSAQQVRITATSTLRYIELRPLGRDSVPAEQVSGSGLLRQLPDGRTVRCVPEDPFCRYTFAAQRVAVIPLIHDVEASAWGFGRGVRAYTQVRARSAWGSGADLWPQATDVVDVLAAYAEFERARYRVRAGRQWQVSGLGFYNFDGVNAGVMPVHGGWVEGYLGRSLVRGLNESRAGSALESVEDLAPPTSGLLAGVHGRYRPSQRLSFAATYQVEFREDGAGLFSELAAADVFWRVGRATVDGSLELDVATAALNEVRVRAQTPQLGGFILHAEARRYRPYFELWTIWGAFSPVGFDEGRGGVAWSDGGGALALRVEGSYRSYDDASVANALDVLRGNGWAASLSAEWSPVPVWRLSASYRVETGFGAARRDGHVGAGYELGKIASVALQALAFQRLYEFRLSEGTVYGLAGEASLRINGRAQLLAGAAAYRHSGAGTADGVDWNQRRGSVRLSWTIGAEPMLPQWRAGVRP